MDNVVELRPGAADSFPSHSNSILPDWPHPRKVTLSIEQCRAIDRDRRHLEDVIRRVNDVRKISTIVETICSADRDEVERAARAISTWLRTGRIADAAQI